MSFASKLALLAGLASTALAHGTVTNFITDGTNNGGFLLDYYYMEQNGQTPPPHAGWYAENLDNGFVDGNDYASSDINCHRNSRPATTSATVSAGGTVEWQWTDWPDSHVGPVITYIANCGGDCADVDVEALKWVKIEEAGFDEVTQEWAAIKLIADGNKWVTPVPSTIAPGNYVFRHEIIALHAAGSLNGAQNYPQCVNIEITGSGTDNPVGVLGTELYTNDEPGILFNPYTTIKDYPIPGPALYTAGSSGGSPSPPVQEPETPTQPAETEAPSVPEPEPTTSVPPPTQGGQTPTLPETFTLSTFIDWLNEVAGSSNLRRHARDVKN